MLCKKDLRKHLYTTLYLFINIGIIICCGGCSPEKEKIAMLKPYQLHNELWGVSGNEKSVSFTSHANCWGYKYVAICNADDSGNGITYVDFKPIKSGNISKLIKENSLNNKYINRTDVLKPVPTSEKKNEVEYYGSHGIMGGAFKGVHLKLPNCESLCQKYNILPMLIVPTSVKDQKTAAGLLTAAEKTFGSNIPENEYIDFLEEWLSKPKEKSIIEMSRKDGMPPLFVVRSGPLLHVEWDHIQKAGKDELSTHSSSGLVREIFWRMNNESLDTPSGKADRITFWRNLLDDIASERNESFRLAKKLLKEKTDNFLLLNHSHTKDMVYPKMFWDSCDYFAGQACPGIIPDELGRKYWVGYSTRLVGDLLDKPMMVGVYPGVFGFTDLLVPKPETLQFWYDQLVQNGVSGAYVFATDYRTEKTLPAELVQKETGSKSASNEQKVQGTEMWRPSPAHIFGQERWDKIFSMTKNLAKSHVFMPPQGEVGIFVSIDNTLVQGWSRIFSSYIELVEAGIWCNFIADDELRAGRAKLEDYKIVFIPELTFASEDMIERLTKYTKQGGIIVACDPEIMSYDMRGRKTLDYYRKELFGISNLSARNSQSQLDFSSEFSSASSVSNGAQFDLSIGEDAVPIASYTNDGKISASMKNLGQGKAIFMGSRIADRYLLYDGKHPNDPGRNKLYKSFIKLSGARDQSWIFEVTIPALLNDL